MKRNRHVDRERKAARGRSLRRGIKWSVLCLLLAAGGFQAVRLADARGWLNLFQIREVRVLGARVAHPGVLVAQSGLMGAELHYWSPLGGYAARVERNPLIAGARLKRSFPNRLVLEIEERTPVALLDLKRLTPVDSEGRILPVSPFTAKWDAPIVTVSWEPDEVVTEGRVGLRQGRRLLAWMGEVDRRYPDLYAVISTVLLDRDGTVRLRLVSSDVTIVLDRSTPIEKLELVDEVVADLRVKGRPYRMLDLRFEDQIVVRS